MRTPVLHRADNEENEHQRKRDDTAASDARSTVDFGCCLEGGSSAGDDLLERSYSAGNVDGNESKIEGVYTRNIAPSISEPA